LRVSLLALAAAVPHHIARCPLTRLLFLHANAYLYRVTRYVLVAHNLVVAAISCSPDAIFSSYNQYARSHNHHAARLLWFSIPCLWLSFLAAFARLFGAAVARLRACVRARA